MEESQMGLFGEEITPPATAAPAPTAPARENRVASPAKPADAADQGKKTASRRQDAPRPTRAAAPPVKKGAVPPAQPVKKRLKSAQVEEGKKISGLVPAGDVRLTANIREDLHLKLKIASARRRTTIGEIIEELIEQYV